MAFVANGVDDEEEKKNQSGVAPAGGGAVHLAPSSGVGSTGPGGSGSAPAKDAGGQFASLDKYIAANQGQASPLAGKITDSIGSQYNALDQGNQGVLQNIQGQVTNAAGYTKGDSGLVAKESADPVGFSGDANNISAFQKQLTNSYGGPNSAEGTNEFQGQQAKLNNAISQGNAQTTTATGRTQLVAQNSAKPTTGVVALNSAILSQDPNHLSKVEDAYKPFQNLVSGLNTGAQDVNKTIASEQADAASSSKAAKDAVTGQISGLNTAVNNQLTAQQGAATAKNAAVKNAVASGNATDSDLSALGISRDQWSSLTGAQKAAATSQLASSADNKFQANTGTTNVDMSQWLKQQDPNAVYNVGNVATADQYKQAGAFQNLLSGLNLETPQLAINPVDASKAGTAPSNLNSFGYQDALGTTAAVAASERASAQAYVNALQSGADEEHAQLAAANASKNANTLAASTSMIGLPTAALSALGVGGDLGKYASQFTQAIGAPVRKAETAAGNAVGNAVNDRGNTATNLLTTGLVNTAGLGIPQAVNTVTKLFCFHPYTLIEMADGTELPICNVQLGDETRGGRVLATLRGVSQDFYWYDGVLVTGRHAVCEAGIWVRVENSAKGRRFPYLTEVVCTLATEKHRIWAHGIEFADQFETDDYDSMNSDESLAALNKNVPLR